MTEGTRALTGPRQVATSFNAIEADYNAGSPTPWRNNMQGTGNNWLDLASGNGFYSETYFDCSGYTRDYLTAYPIDAFCQQAGRVSCSNSGSIRIYSLDIISQLKLDANEIADALFTTGQLPGFPLMNYEWEQIVYGRFQQFIPANQGTAASDVFVRVADDDFGSLEPSTAEKLWVYKIWILPGIPAGPTSLLNLPNSRIVLRMDIRKEDDLPFLMRQKRSYELSNY